MHSLFISFINCIKNNFSNAIRVSCRERRCKLSLNGLSNHVVLKGEKICTDRKICDCIVFAIDNCVIIGIVELKSKDIHASEIVKKLTNGSEIALNILERCKSNYMKFEFYHLVLWKSCDPTEYEVITSRRIIIRGKKHKIIPKRCGSSFSEIISKLK